jgi:hypothetical protein
MTLSPGDRINYFKGILHLNLGKENPQDLESQDIRNWVEILQFDPKFYEFAQKNIVYNQVVFEDPPLFSCKEVARIFMQDCIRIAGRRKQFEPEEFDWIYQVLKKNHIDEQWFLKELFYFLIPEVKSVESRRTGGIFPEGRPGRMPSRDAKKNYGFWFYSQKVIKLSGNSGW